MESLNHILEIEELSDIREGDEVIYTFATYHSKANSTMYGYFSKANVKKGCTPSIELTDVMELPFIMSITNPSHPVGELEFLRGFCDPRYKRKEKSTFSLIDWPGRDRCLYVVKKKVCNIELED